ncbi:DUF885 family protein [Phenylobacterium sp.]|uniref:DUF885 domain-containing protein n=1 Tax=Phenylobacterium sp. TaxID=1871053 RepID=UPI0026010ACE|nr:DUF885 domain-containing protein [Phenylobacterium sp.]
MAAAAAAGPAAAQGAQDAALTKLLDADYEALLQMDPDALTRLGRKEHYGELTDRSDAGVDARLKRRRASVAAMRKAFDPKALGEDARTSFEMWALELERAERQRRWAGHSYVFDRNGAHTRLPNFLINFHRVTEVSDMDAYVARLAAAGPALDEQIGRAQRAAAAGVRMPRFSYDQSLEEVRRITTGAPFTGGPDSALFADAKGKIGALRARGKIDDAKAAAYEKAVVGAMTERVKPAYDRLAAWLAADRDRTSPEPRGAGALPDGAAYYDAMLADQTTTAMTADEIHKLGLSEVKRLRAEMEALKGRIGFAGSLGEFFAYMRTEPRFYLPATDAGRAEYLRLAQGYLDGMKAKLPEVFPRLPRAALAARRVEAFREEPGGAAHYSSGAPDGSRPGVFYVHLADMTATPTFELEGTAYHEGWPGHHMQISLAQEMRGAQEMKGLPVFRTQAGYGAYVEGWGLYSELLAKEMGFYQDPYSDFGRLGREIWRGIRLVVDTGIHAKGWSEAQALDYYTSNSPQPAAKIRSEIRRYFTTPGQATSYKVGMVRILALRARAKAALGPRFDIKGFHEAVLGAGSLPLSVLDARVERWMKRA